MLKSIDFGAYCLKKEFEGESMNGSRRIILYVYLISNIIFGILLVPMRAIWGTDNTLKSVSYVPIWTTTMKSMIINGTNPVYQIDSSRLGFTLLVIAIIALTLMLIFSEETEVKVVENTKNQLQHMKDKKGRVNKSEKTKIY